jgi:hypothetical protein
MRSAFSGPPFLPAFPAFQRSAVRTHVRARLVETVGAQVHNGVMKQRIRVCDLVHELRISSLDVVHAAHALGINVIRATALLTSGQEYRIREWHANGHIRRRRVQSVVERPALPTPEEKYKSAKCDCCDYVFLYKPLHESHHLCRECRSHLGAALLEGPSCSDRGGRVEVAGIVYPFPFLGQVEVPVAIPVVVASEQP